MWVTSRLYLLHAFFSVSLGWEKAKSKWPWGSGIEDGNVATSVGP